MLRAVQDIHQLTIISCVNEYANVKTPICLKRMQETFLATSEIYGRYDQIRYIDLNGQEIVRINNQHSQASITPDDQLQNKATRYFIQ